MKKVCYLLIMLLLFGTIMTGCSEELEQPTEPLSGETSNDPIKEGAPEDETKDPETSKSIPPANSFIDPEDYMGISSTSGPYFLVEDYAVNFGYEPMKIGDYYGLYCQNEYGIAVVYFMSGSCIFATPTSQENEYHFFQIQHSIESAEKNGEDIIWVETRDRIWKYGHRVTDALKLGLEWMATTGDPHADPFPEIEGSTYYATLDATLDESNPEMDEIFWENVHVTIGPSGK